MRIVNHRNVLIRKISATISVGLVILLVLLAVAWLFFNSSFDLAQLFA